MHAIISHSCIKAHKPKILLVTPPPINEVHLEAEDLKKGQDLTRHQSVTKQFAEVVRKIASEYCDQGVVLVDLWKAMMEKATALEDGGSAGPAMLGSKEKGDSKGLRELLVDGLHLTGAGYKVFLDEVLPKVGKEWAEEPPNDPSWIFP